VETIFKELFSRGEKVAPEWTERRDREGRGGGSEKKKELPMAKRGSYSWTIAEALGVGRDAPLTFYGVTGKD